MKNNLIAIVSLLLFSYVLFGSCSKGGGSSYGGSNNNNSTGSGNNISINNMQFGTGSLTVKAGTTVTWTNREYMTHTVTADDNSFTSGDLDYGGSYSHTFATQGTFPYHCKYHSSMIATVTAN